MERRIFSHLLFLFFLLFSASSAFALEINTTPPDFTLPTVDGHKITLSGYKGHIIILKLATTWCPTCRQEVQEILAAGKELKKAGAVVVEVFVQDTKEMVENAEKGKVYPVPHVALLDDTHEVYSNYNVYLIPRVILISRKFKVYADYSGLVPADKLIEKVKALAAEK